MRNETKNSNKKHVNLVTIIEISWIILQQLVDSPDFCRSTVLFYQNISFVTAIFRIFNFARISANPINYRRLSNKMNIKVSENIQILGWGFPWRVGGLIYTKRSGWQRGPRLSTSQDSRRFSRRNVFLFVCISFCLVCYSFCLVCY